MDVNLLAYGHPELPKSRLGKSRIFSILLMQIKDKPFIGKPLSIVEC